MKRALIFISVLLISLQVFSFENFSDTKLKESYDLALVAFYKNDAAEMKKNVIAAENYVDANKGVAGEDKYMIIYARGLYETIVGRSFNASEKLQQAYDYFDKAGDSKGVNTVGMNYGRALYESYEYEKAVKVLDRVYAYFSDMKESDYGKSVISMALYYLMLSHYSLAQYQQSAQNALEVSAIDFYYYGSSSGEYMTDMAYLGSSYYKLGEYYKSTDKFSAASTYIETTSVFSAFTAGTFFQEYGTAYFKQGYYYSAGEKLKKAIDKFVKAGKSAEYQLVDTYIAYGDAQMENTDYEGAKLSYESSLKLASDKYGSTSGYAKKAESRLDSLKTREAAYKKEQKKMAAQNGCLGFRRYFSTKLSLDLLQSAGRQYWGGGLGFATMGYGVGIHYLYSFPSSGRSAGVYVPLVITKYLGNSLTLTYGFDIPSLFAKNNSDKLNTEAPYARELGLLFSFIPYVPLSAKYIWSTGGNLPQGLSLGASVRYYF